MHKIHFSASPEIVAAARPTPGAGQLLIRTELVGVHLGLLRLLRSGGTDAGAEVVGTVVAVGPGVDEGWVGKAVGGIVFEGAYAEFALALPQLVAELPAGVDPADGLAVVRGGLVALGALRAGRFGAGDSILISGAASGSGHLAVQLARAFGAKRLVAAAGSMDKARFLEECGADEVRTYDQLGAERFDVVLDGLGGDFVQRGVASLAPHGRLVAYSAGGGSVDAGSLLAELKTVTGFSMGLLGRERPELVRAYRDELWNLLAQGRIRPRHTVFPFDRIAEAMDLVAARRNVGRVAVRVGAAG
ncbi:zinc-binding dehydrogenase [Nocardia sp. CDC159]|uniref:Zinc-binding dehydrogenase n=1 Tax=Nocardia pulmonis TaxID=2951408 RepID=A0A9X2IXW3_9NOCA|nr:MULTISPECIES: zinc-binding dehydrogenase [Nocardia]MCM6776437.1 zinc-binding dehydrogenase [Nocardia pulmonis]MCM6788861.1 zinc-binding dehydrogenase [Nocardia sp. CDC159]